VTLNVFLADQDPESRHSVLNPRLIRISRQPINLRFVRTQALSMYTVLAEYLVCGGFHALAWRIMLNVLYNARPVYGMVLANFDSGALS